LSGELVIDKPDGLMHPLHPAPSVKTYTTSVTGGNNSIAYCLCLIMSHSNIRAVAMLATQRAAALQYS